MTDKTAGRSICAVPAQAGEQGGVRAEKMSRRFFGQMLGMPALLASTVTLSACGGGDSEDPAVIADSKTLTRAAFVATVSDYFDWVHSSEYHDPYKSTQQTFVDVRLGATTGPALLPGLIERWQHAPAVILYTAEQDTALRTLASDNGWSFLSKRARSAALQAREPRSHNKNAAAQALSEKNTVVAQAGAAPSAPVKASAKRK